MAKKGQDPNLEAIRQVFGELRARLKKILNTVLKVMIEKVRAVGSALKEVFQRAKEIALMTGQKVIMKLAGLWKKFEAILAVVHAQFLMIANQVELAWAYLRKATDPKKIKKFLNATWKALRSFLGAMVGQIKKLLAMIKPLRTALAVVTTVAEGLKAVLRSVGRVLSAVSDFMGVPGLAKKMQAPLKWAQKKIDTLPKLISQLQEA